MQVAQQTVLHTSATRARGASRHPAGAPAFDLTGRTALVTGSTRGLGEAIAWGSRGRSAGGDQRAGAATARRWRRSIRRRSGGGAVRRHRRGAVVAAVERLGRRRHPREQRGDDASQAPPRLVAGSGRASSPSTYERVSRLPCRRAPMIERGGGKDRQRLLGHERARARDERALHGHEGRAEEPHPGDVRRVGPASGSRRTRSAGLLRHRADRAASRRPRFDTWLKVRVPAGRWADPSELAGAAVFLASAASDFVNGQVIYVDGGLTAVV